MSKEFEESLVHNIRELKEQVTPALLLSTYIYALLAMEGCQAGQASGYNSKIFADLFGVGPQTITSYTPGVM